MLNPRDTYELNQLASPYANVVAISKRARTISEEAEQEHIIMSEKPLKIAIEEFIDGKYKVDKVITDEEWHDA